jgi:hypothetical protein
MQRPSRERREAGAENRARIDQVRIGDDSLRERLLRLRQQRTDQSIGKPWRHAARRLLRGLAAAPILEAALGLAAEVSRGNKFV